MHSHSNLNFHSRPGLHMLLPTTLIVALTLCALGTYACAAKNQASRHPNQLSTFDGLTYDTLLVAQSSLKQAKVEVQTTYPQFKAQFNQAAAAYNAVLSAYKTYHVSGGGDTTQLQTQIDDLVSKIAALERSFGLTPGGI